MRNYTTQMDAARQGIITPEMKAVARRNTEQKKKSENLLQKDRLLSVQTRTTPALIQTV